MLMVRLDLYRMHDIQPQLLSRSVRLFSCNHLFKYFHCDWFLLQNNTNRFFFLVKNKLCNNFLARQQAAIIWTRLRFTMHINKMKNGLEESPLFQFLRDVLFLTIFCFVNRILVFSVYLAYLN